MKTHIVIPIGVGAPGTPVQEYLEQSVNCILDQTSKDFILTVAADSNIPDRCKQFLEEKNINIMWFEPFSVFRKGGFIKKCFDAWQNIDSKYIAFLHYDDLWDSDKLRTQITHIEERSLSGSFSEVYIIDSNNQVISGDCSFAYLDVDTVGRRTAAFAHSCILNKEDFFKSGILETEDKWSQQYYDKYKIGFEDLWSLYVHKMGKVEKSLGSKMYWRNHEKNLSNTFFAQIDSHPSTEIVIEQKKMIQYNPEEVLSYETVNEYLNLINEVKKQY